MHRAGQRCFELLALIRLALVILLSSSTLTWFCAWEMGRNSGTTPRGSKQSEKRSLSQSCKRAD